MTVWIWMSLPVKRDPHILKRRWNLIIFFWLKVIVCKIGPHTASSRPIVRLNSFPTSMRSLDTLPTLRSAETSWVLYFSNWAYWFSCFRKDGCVLIPRQFPVDESGLIHIENKDPSASPAIIHLYLSIYVQLSNSCDWLFALTVSKALHSSTIPWSACR